MRKRPPWKLDKYVWSVYFDFEYGSYGIAASPRHLAIRYIREECARLDGQGKIPERIRVSAEKMPCSSPIKFACRHILRFPEENREQATWEKERLDKQRAEWEKIGQLKEQIRQTKEYGEELKKRIELAKAEKAANAGKAKIVLNIEERDYFSFLYALKHAREFAKYADDPNCDWHEKEKAGVKSCMEGFEEIMNQADRQLAAQWGEKYTPEMVTEVREFFLSDAMSNEYEQHKEDFLAKVKGT